METSVLVSTMVLGVLIAGQTALIWNRFGEIEDRFARLEARMDERFARVDERFARVDERIDAVRSDITQVALAVGARRPKVSGEG